MSTLTHTCFPSPPKRTPSAIALSFAFYCYYKMPLQMPPLNATATTNATTKCHYYCKRYCKRNCKCSYYCQMLLRMLLPPQMLLLLQMPISYTHSSPASLAISIYLSQILCHVFIQLLCHSRPHPSAVSFNHSHKSSLLYSP